MENEKPPSVLIGRIKSKEMHVIVCDSHITLSKFHCPRDWWDGYFIFILHWFSKSYQKLILSHRSSRTKKRINSFLSREIRRTYYEAVVLSRESKRKQTEEENTLKSDSTVADHRFFESCSDRIGKETKFLVDEVTMGWIHFKHIAGFSLFSYSIGPLDSKARLRASWIRGFLSIVKILKFSQ